MTDQDAERRAIIELLPWHAAGTLDAEDAARVEEAMAQDPELARHLALIEEERGETIHLSESAAVPSARLGERLFAAIETQGRGWAPMAAPASGFGGRLRQFLAGLAPSTLAWSAAAAALVILLQAGLIGSLLLGERGAYETASYQGSNSGKAASLLVRFAPQASAADITAFLQSYKASIVDGPRAGGLFRLRVAVSGSAPDEAARIASRMQQDKIVGFAGVGE
jgi:anti-sigma factor RsiW